MSRWLRILVAASLFIGLAGCRSMWPKLFSPGTIESQRSSAAIHDPYPDNQAGPKVVGGRPQFYEKQQAEPVRDRLWRETGGRGY